MKTAVAKSSQSIFYVYEHWRQDTGEVFYVGKGHGNRAWSLSKRKLHHRNIVAKLRRLGFEPHIVLFASGLSEPDALRIECERIAFWRERGVRLVNLTDGGEGVCGYVPSVETRLKLAQGAKNRIGYKHSEETKRKIGVANAVALKGRKNPEHGEKLRGRKQSPETITKRMVNMIGRVVSKETKAKIAYAHTGQKRSESARENMRLAHLGKKDSPETIERKRVAQRARWERARCQQS